jgi:hypothetical protein
MLDRLQERAERIGAEAVDRARRRVAHELEEQGMRVSTSAQGVTVEGRRLSERLGWIGGLVR